MKQVTVKHLAKVFTKLAEEDPNQVVSIVDDSGDILDDIIGVIRCNGLTSSYPKVTKDVAIIVGPLHWYNSQKKKFHPKNNESIDRRFDVTSDNLL